jgi:dipeptidyl aminopeptidase/acylaminoacyl peptidase
MADPKNNAVVQDAPIEAPYGSWKSPIEAEMVAKGALRLSQPMFGQGEREAIYWLEGRPAEAGRSALVKASLTGLTSGSVKMEDVTKAPVSIRSLVHEYGGGGYLAAHGNIFYSNFDDQRVYLLPAESPVRSGGQPSAQPNAQPNARPSAPSNARPSAQPSALSNAQPSAPQGAQSRPLTVPFDSAHSHRYADYCYDSNGQKLFAVMEEHGPDSKEPANSIVAINVPAAAAGDIIAPLVIAHGRDFYSCPRLSPDGGYLAYLCWNHPNMPWDGCELRVVTLDANANPGEDRLVAGGAASIFQPQWSPEGRLFFISDESGYWQPRVVSDMKTLQAEALLSEAKYAECEFGQPLWSFAQSTYAVLSDRLAVFAINRRGLWSLLRLDLDFSAAGAHKVSEIESPYSEFSYLSGSDDQLVMLAASAVLPQSVVHLDLSSGRFTTIKAAADQVPSQAFLSTPEVIEFPTDGGLTAFAFFYPPSNANYVAPSGSGNEAGASAKPPLVVKCHGGPTGAASSSLSLSIQYWTSRGFAVVDVNYGGSTGFGRAYRERLNGNWGVVDVADCRRCVEYLIAEGRVDADRVAITGGSAGGYTVLCALTFTDTFKAGASHYGIGDLEALARDTHKFESRYEDNLVAPYPAGRALYIERSPIHHVEQLNCPVIFFQGLDDKIVPPNQAEAMVDALKAKGIAVACIAYEGESHGFRKSENIIKTIKSEYYFFSRIFGIPTDEDAVVHIDNLD